MKFLTDPSYLYWITGAIALAAYWFAKPKGDATINARNIIYSALMVFIGLAIGSFSQGTDPGGMAIAYAVTTGLAGGTTVKSVADLRARGKAQ